jgi:signal transduction histidine kinase
VQFSREVETIFTQIAHDLAEPLQALIADIDVLKYQANILNASMTPKELSINILDISNRASHILLTGLDLSSLVRRQLDAGIDGATTRVVKGRVNLYRLLNSLVELWDERAASKGVEIKTLFSELRGVGIRCDETELKSALGHLLGNAIKYSFSGHRQSRGSLAKFDRYVNIFGKLSMGMVSIEFQNYGVGILKNELIAVKEKFYRGELAVKEGRAGSGRGLWSANQFFEFIGGTIEINSEYKGSNPLSREGPYSTTVKVIIPYINSEEV